MKKKSIYVILVLTMLSFLTVACSKPASKSSSSASTSITPNPNKEKVIQQLIKNGEQINSLDAHFNMEMETTTKTDEIQSGKTAVKLDMSAIREPLAVKLDMGMSFLDSEMTMQMYLKDGTLYSKVPEEAWFKEDSKEAIAQIQQQLDAIYDKDIFKALQEGVRDASIVEKDGNYEIDVKDVSKALQVNLRHQLAAMQVGNPDNVQFKETRIHYVIDKKTVLPKSVTLSATIENDEVDYHFKIETTYSNINQVKDIQVPEDALQASE